MEPRYAEPWRDGDVWGGWGTGGEWEWVGGVACADDGSCEECGGEEGEEEGEGGAGEGGEGEGEFEGAD